MTWLLDVSVLIARILTEHEHHDRVMAWWAGRTTAICPITELGFLRIACALGAKMAEARHALATFLAAETPIFIPCDRRALDCSAFISARKTTDIYLAELAMARGWKFATLDTGIVHSHSELIPELSNLP